MIGSFGKIPSKPDFVRAGHSDAQTRAFEQWLDESCLRLRECGVEVPAGGVRFVMRAAEAENVLIGTLRPSRDAIGRRFPLSVFHALQWSVMEHRWSALPALAGPFVESAEQLIADAAALDVERLRMRVTSLWTPTSHDIASMDSLCAGVLQNTPWLVVAERVFGGDRTLDHAAYAFRTFFAALQREGVAALDCPIAVDLDLFFWLELLRRVSRSSTFMLLWMEDPLPRLVVSVGGPAPLSLLLALADGSREQQQIWPLRTSRPAALEVAAQVLGETLESIRAKSIEHLFAELARTAGSAGT